LRIPCCLSCIVAWISEQSHSPPATPSTSWDRRWESPERHLNNTDRRKNRHDEAQDVAVIPRRRHFQTVAEFENEERTLKALIGSAAYELDLQMKKKTSMMNKSSKTAIDESINHTKKRLEKLRNILQELRSHRNLNSSRFCVPKKPPFTASEVRTCQKPAKMSDSPTFYKNSDTWDFGYDSRYSDQTTFLNFNSLSLNAISNGYNYVILRVACQN
jgi:hypothetical protein